MTKAKTTTPAPDDEAERLAAEEAARAEADRLATEEAAKAEADRLAAEEAAKAEADRLAAEEAAKAKLRALIEEIEAHMHHELMPYTIATLTESDGLSISQDAAQMTVILQGIESVAATTNPVVAMGVWCNAARRHLAEVA